MRRAGRLLPAGIAAACVIAVARLGEPRAGATLSWKTLGPPAADARLAAIDPFDSRTILVAPSGSGLQRTRDAGRSWQGVGGQDWLYTDLAADPVSPGRFYAIAQSVPLPGEPSTSALLKTDDRGDHWTLVGPELPFTNFTSVRVGSGSVVYLAERNCASACEGRLLRSGDGGLHWADITGFSASFVRVLAADPAGSGRVFVFAGTALYESDDGGGSWRAIPDAGRQSCRSVTALALDGSDAKRIVLAAAEIGGSPAPTLSCGDLFRTEDGGSTWVAAPVPGKFWISAAIPAGGGARIFAAANAYGSFTPPAGVLVSDDGGATWRDTGIASSSVFSVAAASDGRIYAATSDGLRVYSSDLVLDPVAVPAPVPVSGR